MPDLSATKVWSYLATTTFERVAPFIADNITARIFLLHALAELKGIQQEVMGGLDIRFPILKELATAVDYTDLDTLAPARANPGSDRAISSVLTIMLQAAEQGLRDRLGGSSGIFSANTDSATGVAGLQDLLTHASNAQPTTGTVGGLNRATFTTWRNQVVDVANDFSANGYAGLTELWLRAQRGDEVPDILVFSLSSYLNFLRNATSSVQYNLPLTSNEGMLNVGFSNVNFNGAITGYDDGVAADMAYLLNSKYCHWVAHENRNFTLGPSIATDTLDALTWWISWMGNFNVSNMARQGLLRRADTN